MKQNIKLTPDNAFNIIFEYWAEKNKIKDLRIEKTVFHPGEICFSNYDDWKTTLPEDRYRTSTYKAKIDMDDLYSAIHDSWEEDVDESIYKEYENDFNGFYNEVIYLFDSVLQDFLDDTYEYETSNPDYEYDY